MDFNDKAIDIYSSFEAKTTRSKELLSASKSLNRLRTNTPLRRNTKFIKEIQDANIKRLKDEITRPKILIENVSIEKPKPVSHYIKRARKTFLLKYKQPSHKRSASTERIKLTSPQKSPCEKTFDNRHLSALARYSSASIMRAASPIKKESEMKNYISN